MEKNRLQRALENERRNGKVIDLIDTNFHRNGFLFPEAPLRGLTAEYLSSRSYDPDPKGSRKARKAISAYYTDAGIGIEADAILITASASESYDLLFSTLASEGDSILLPAPGYPLFEYLAGKSGLETAFYRLDPNDKYRIDLESLKAAITIETRFLVLISPNNPTGKISAADELSEILKLCEHFGVMLIVDEVFSEFNYSAKPLPRPAAIGSEVQVFTLNGISKMFACPDLKLSWIACSGNRRKTTAAVESLEVANDVFLSCSSLSQFILPGLFEKGRDFQSRMIEETDRRRKLLVEKLSSSPGISFTEPDGGIHAVLHLDESRYSDDETFALSLLTEQKVYVHPGYFYGIEEGLSLVVSFLKNYDELEEGLDRLIRFIARS